MSRLPVLERWQVKGGGWVALRTRHAGAGAVAPSDAMSPGFTWMILAHAPDIFAVCTFWLCHDQSVTLLPRKSVS